MADLLDRLVARARQTPRVPSAVAVDLPQLQDLKNTGVAAPSPLSTPAPARMSARSVAPAKPPPPTLVKSPTPTPLVATATQVAVTNLVQVVEQTTPALPLAPPSDQSGVARPAAVMSELSEVARPQPAVTVERTELTERHLVEQVAAPASAAPQPPRPTDAERPSARTEVVTAHPLPVLPPTPVTQAASSSIAAASSTTPEVHVHIGRVDIRGPEQPMTQPRPEAPSAHPAPTPVVSLGDYLHGRDAIGRRS